MKEPISNKIDENNSRMRHFKSLKIHDFAHRLASELGPVDTSSKKCLPYNNNLQKNLQTLQKREDHS